MELSKKECEKALTVFGQLIFTYSEKTLKPDKCREYLTFAYLINNHFKLQLTSGECDLIEFALKPLEYELGMDVTLLIDKIRNHKILAPKDEGVVTCVEMD